MDVSYRTTLELDKIIARAVQLCTCAETKEMMRSIEPFATTEEERYALAQTNAINALLLKTAARALALCMKCAAWWPMRPRAAFFRWASCWKLLQRCAIFRPGPVVRPDRPRYAAHR